MMKKLLGIVVLSLFICFNPLVIKFSYAGLLDMFKDPLEICMDRVIKSLGGSKLYTGDAAYACSGANRSTGKCMDRVIKSWGGSKIYTDYAAKKCTGKK